MATLTELLKVEETIENALVSKIAALGYTASAQRSNVEVNTPHVAVQVVLGEVLRWRSTKIDDDYPAEAWRFMLNVGVFTARGDDSQSHVAVLSEVRQLLYKWQTELGIAALPDHGIMMLNHNGTSPEIQGENNIDQSAMTFSGAVTIRGSSWPV